MGIGLMGSTPAATGALVGAAAATMVIALVVFGVLWTVAEFVARWKVFRKAGRPGWYGLIPYVGEWGLIDIGWSRKMAWVYAGTLFVSTILYPMFQKSAGNEQGVPVFLAVVMVILSLVLMYFSVMSAYKLAKAFGKGIWFAIGLIFLDAVFMMILGCGKSEYLGRQS